MKKLFISWVLVACIPNLFGKAIISDPLISGPRIVRGIVNTETYPQKTNSWSTSYEPTTQVITIMFHPAFNKQPVFTAIAVGQLGAGVQVGSVTKNAVNLNYLGDLNRPNRFFHFIAIESE